MRLGGFRIYSFGRSVRCRDFAVSFDSLGTLEDHCSHQRILFDRYLDDKTDPGICELLKDKRCRWHGFTEFKSFRCFSLHSIIGSHLHSYNFIAALMSPSHYGIITWNEMHKNQVGGGWNLFSLVELHWDNLWEKSDKSRQEFATTFVDFVGVFATSTANSAHSTSHSSYHPLTSFLHLFLALSHSALIKSPIQPSTHHV